MAETAEEYGVAPKDIPKLVKKLRKEMLAAAKELDFEKAAEAARPGQEAGRDGVGAALDEHSGAGYVKERNRLI